MYMEKHMIVQPHEFNLSDYTNFVIVGRVNEVNIQIAVMGVKSKKEYQIILRHTYPTMKEVKLTNILNDCLREAHDFYRIEISRCVIAAAGPIARRREYIKLTNIDYKISQSDILKNTMLSKVILINDFEAFGYGINILNMEKDVSLIPHVGEDLSGSANFMNNFAVVGAGNGLGVSIAYYDRTKHMHQPLPSEGGHMEFSPHDELELELVNYLKANILIKKEAHPEMERLVSRHGIVNIYQFLRKKKRLFKQTQLMKNMDSLNEEDMIEAIRENPGEPICKKTVEMFIAFYARAARNIALISECYSGLFLSGDLVLKFTKNFYDGSFMKEFEIHDIRSDILRKTPVYILENIDTPFYGCCNVAMNFYNLCDK